MKLKISLLIVLSCAVLSSYAAPRNRNYTYDEKLLVFKWLLTYRPHYFKDVRPTEQNIDDLMNKALRSVKRFYQLSPINGKITAQIMTLINTPRCQDADEPVESSRKKRFTRLSQDKWTRMPVKVSFKNFLTGQRIRSDEQKSIMKECTELWARESKLSFKVLDRGLGDIEAEFIYIDGPWNTVGRGLSPTPYWPDKPSYIKLDSAEKWKKNAKNTDKHKVSMKWAMCHELGHTLGLGHSSDRKAIMYPSGVGQAEDRLGVDDINGIRAIYGWPDNLQTARRTTTPRRRTTTTATTRRPRVTRPRVTRPRVTRPRVTRPRVTHPRVTRTTTTQRPKTRTTTSWVQVTPKPGPKPTRRRYRNRPHPYSFQYWWNKRYGSNSSPHVGK